MQRMTNKITLKDCIKSESDDIDGKYIRSYFNDSNNSPNNLK